MSFEHLFKPLTVGPVEFRNRVIFGAHFTMFTEPNPVWGEPGYYGQRYGRYLADRAQGGVAAVIAGETAVSANTAYKMPNNANGWDPECIPHYEQLTDQVHAHNTLALLQLTHSGAMMLGNWSKQVAIGPSVSPDYSEAPKAMDQKDIRAVIDAHVVCAQNAVAGGFDGIEIQSAHGYLLHQFLSPKFNFRTDAYGGSLENRMRIGTEIVHAVREAVGDKIVVGIRLAGDDEQRHGPGLTADDCGDIAAAYEDLGLADYFNVSVGVGGVGMVRTNYSPHLFGVYAAHTIKKAVRNTPVFAVHRILTPEEADGIIARHEADGITLVRALIADPEWTNKAAAGRATEIRQCTGINASCYGNLLQSMPINCVQNPAVGREADLGLGTLSLSATPKRLVVIGGGPGGLEAATTAAARGHQVILLEQNDQLGGALHWAAQLPGRQEIWEIAKWRINECQRLGVDVRLGFTATVESVLALNPEAIIVATGGHATKFGRSAYQPMPIAGAEADWVIDHVAALMQLLENPDSLGGRVVIIDALGHAAAIGLGEMLATIGHSATCVTPLPMPIGLDSETQAAILPRAVQAGMIWRPNNAVVAIGDHEVIIVDVHSHQLETLSKIDSVIIVTHGLPNEELFLALEVAATCSVVRVGNAVSVRPVDRAVYEGHVAARAL